MIGGILIAAALLLSPGDCVKDPGGQVYQVVDKTDQVYALLMTDGSGRLMRVPIEMVETQGKKVKCK